LVFKSGKIIDYISDRGVNPKQKEIFNKSYFIPNLWCEVKKYGGKKAGL
jgi:hypothetical protein